jgi:Holliday junction resolvase-like predicted endonuclease
MIEYNKEQEKKLRQQDKKVKDLNYLFVNQWGQLVESLVEGKIVELLNDRGIKVQHTATNMKSFKDEAEIDIIAENGNEIVVIEVKTTLRNDYIDEFLEKLTNFKKYFPKYQENIVYGAMAYLKSPENIVARAKKQGLLLIKATGDSARIVNSKEFKPKAW